MTRAPVFIVGSPRSGTTWLYHLLLSAGGFAIYRFEAHVFNTLGPRFGGFRQRKNREAFLSRWLKSEYFFRSGLDESSFSSRVLEECRSSGDFLRLLMESIATDQGASRWAECTPESILYMAEIQASFPDALFVHIVRDGRDVASSLARQRSIRPLPLGQSRELVAAALYWEWMTQKGRAGAAMLGTSYMEVRFADLVTNPRETLAVIGQFINHPMHYERILSAGIGSVSKPNTSFQSEVRGGQFQPVERWRTAYSEQELKLVESLIGDQLAEMGFELATSPQEHSRDAISGTIRALYRTRFKSRTWLKSHTPLGRYFVDTTLLDYRLRDDDVEETLRPALHRDVIRALVGSDSGDWHRDGELWVRQQPARRARLPLIESHRPTRDRAVACFKREKSGPGEDPSAAAPRH